MALAWATIAAAIKAWLAAAAPSVTWYLGDQGLPRPALPCGQWRWQRESTPDAQGLASDDARMSAATTRQVLRYRRHLLELDCQSSSVVGDATARRLLAAAKDALQLESVRLALYTAGVVLVADDIRDVTALFPDRAESRAVLEITVSTADSATEDVGAIETVTPLTGTVA